MLEPKEARKVYESLSKILTDEGLEWLLQDVQRQIALGKQMTKEIQVESTVGVSTAGHHTKKKAARQSS